MGTLIWSTRKTKVKGCTILRPCPSLAPAREIQLSRQKTKKPASPPAHLESRTITSPPSLEWRMRIPSPALQYGPEGSPSIHSSSSSSSSCGAPEGTSMRNFLHAAQPDGGTPVPPSSHSEDQQMAMRPFSFLFRLMFYRLTTKKQPLKRTRVKPIKFLKLWTAKAGPQSKTRGGQAALLAFQTPNLEVLSSKEASHKVREMRQRLDVNSCK